jgi:hypothetical protein
LRNKSSAYFTESISADSFSSLFSLKRDFNCDFDSLNERPSLAVGLADDGVVGSSSSKHDSGSDSTSFLSVEIVGFIGRLLAWLGNLKKKEEKRQVELEISSLKYHNRQVVPAKRVISER